MRGVRLARVPDVERIGAITVASWRTRLAGLVPDDVLDALDADALGFAWTSGILTPPSPHHRLLVAVDEAGDAEEVVGFIALGPSEDPDADADALEILALEVDPAHQRAGHGSRLVSAAVDLARPSGVTVLTVWCPLPDEARRGFLQSSGWGPDSAYRDVEVGGPADAPTVLREVRLVTGLLDG
jgi:GNAT superfamily N-acetyltransferase